MATIGDSPGGEVNILGTFRSVHEVSLIRVEFVSIQELQLYSSLNRCANTFPNTECDSTGAMFEQTSYSSQAGLLLLHIA